MGDARDTVVDIPNNLAVLVSFKNMRFMISEVFDFSVVHKVEIVAQLGT